MASYTSKVIAVMGRMLRAGRWKLADDTLVIALFGRCVLDLTRAYVDEDDDDLTLSIFAVFGSVSILLPPGCDVEPSGVAIVASTEIDIPSERPGDITRAALAPLDISWLACFAKVRVAEVCVEETSVLPPDDVAAMLAPPAVEVFGGNEAASPVAAVAAVGSGALASPIESGPAVDSEPAPIETSEPFEDPASEAALLRDEIAKWRAESGRSDAQDDPPEASLTLSPEDEIIDEVADPAAFDDVTADETVAP